MASVTKTHKPLPLRQEDFRPGYLNPISYSMEDVSKALVNHLKQHGSEENLTSVQRSALERCRYAGCWNLGQSNLLSNLKRSFSCFNDVYFNGVLTDYCSLEILPPGMARKRYGLPVDACCEYSWPGEERDPKYRLPKPTMNLAIELPESTLRPIDRVQHMLQNILHEMLHALLAIFSCRCRNGCLERSKYPHGIPWLAAAHALEVADSFDSRLLGLGCDLNRHEILVFETQVMGMDILSDTVMEDLKLNLYHINMIVQRVQVGDWREG